MAILERLEAAEASIHFVFGRLPYYTSVQYDEVSIVDMLCWSAPCGLKCRC